MNFAIGTDIEDISRFEGKSQERDSAFLKRIFTDNELKYCFSKTLYAPSLCARFCAKESVVKALSEFGITDVYYSDIEILNNEQGKPNCRIAKYPDIKIKVSLSHCKNYATANALLTKD